MHSAAQQPQPPPPIRFHHPQNPARHLLLQLRDRQLLTHLLHTATATLRDCFRPRLNLPDGKLGAIAAILRFRLGSFEWQAIGKLTEVKNALRSLGKEGLLMRSLGQPPILD